VKGGINLSRERQSELPRTVEIASPSMRRISLEVATRGAIIV
jgi:hypothetical protein